MTVRTNKPTPSRIIVSGLEIVEPCLVIVVIATVSEGIEGRDLRIDLGQRCSAWNENCEIAPCVVVIRADRGGIGRAVNANDIALQVLLEEVILIYAFCIAVRAILETDRRAILVVDVEHHLVFPLLAKDLAAVENVRMLYAVDGLARADALVIIRIRGAAIDIFGEFAIHVMIISDRGQKPSVPRISRSRFVRSTVIIILALQIAESVVEIELGITPILYRNSLLFVNRKYKK